MEPKDDAMISRIVNNLLKTEKRVTVPALGSFMRRADGTIVFTEMFKDNDGVLVRHVAQVLSLSPLEATEDVARFVEHIERELLSRGMAELSDLGILTRNAQGNITFVSNSSVTYQPEQPVAKPQPVEPAKPAQEPKAQVKTPVVSAPMPQKQVVEAPRTATQEIPAERNSAQRRRRAPMPEEKKRDWVLIIAIAAAVFAAISMLYGILNSDVTSTIIL